MTGRVIRGRGKIFTVSAEGKEYECEVLAKAKRETGQTPVAVGDLVDFVVTPDGRGGIERTHPRTTKFSRPKVGTDEPIEQVIVSNIDQLMIVSSVKQPPFKQRLLDRFIVASLKGGLSPIIIINKIDLKHSLDLDRIIRIYESVGVSTVLTSCIDGRGIEKLRDLLKDHESIFAGHSGTGKSSLLNMIQPGLALATARVSDATSKGIHTTSSVELYSLSFGGYVVDSPGLKVLGLWDLDQHELQDYFPEFEEYRNACKFRRCSHLHEPECAVRQAVSEHKIFHERFQSYEKLYHDLEQRKNLW